MGIYNISVIKSIVDFETVLNYHGAESMLHGNYLDFLCPFHPDSRIGNCKSKRGRDGRFVTARCYACGHESKPGSGSFDVIDYEMKVSNCSFNEALEHLAQMTGSPKACLETREGRIAREKKRKEIKALHLLSPEDAELIGMSSEAFYIPYKISYDGNTEGAERTTLEFHDENEYFVHYKSVGFNPVIELAKEDRALYEEFVRNKCEEKILLLIDMVKDPSKKAVVDQLKARFGFDQIFYMELDRIFKKILKIYREYGGTLDIDGIRAHVNSYSCAS